MFSTVPKCYHRFEHIFTQEAFNEMPPNRPWDHAIELLPGAEVMDSKIYPLNLEEQKQLDVFLEENLPYGVMSWTERLFILLLLFHLYIPAPIHKNT